MGIGNFSVMRVRPEAARLSLPLMGSIAITTNRAYKHWPEIFNHDATPTSAVLHRLIHHAETVTLEGKSFRMKDVSDR